MTSTRRQLHRRVVAACFTAVAFALQGCNWLTDIPSGSQPFSPPAIYTRWWSAAESCSGLSRDMGTIRWFRSPGAEIDRHGEALAGFYSPSGSYIVLADSSVDDGGTVRHEMLHALINAPGHPTDQFLGNCKDVVDCEGQCVKDAGPWRAPAPFVPLSVDSMSVSSTVALLPPEKDGERWVALTVTAVNPLGTPIFALPHGAWLTWGVENGYVSASLSADDSSSLYFDAHQRRTWTYEMRVANSRGDYTLSPGSHYVDGGFGQNWTPFTQIIAEP